jgi:hypothetical protein
MDIEQTCYHYNMHINDGCRGVLIFRNAQFVQDENIPPVAYSSLAAAASCCPCSGQERGAP